MIFLSWLTGNGAETRFHTSAQYTFTIRVGNVIEGLVRGENSGLPDTEHRFLLRLTKIAKKWTKISEIVH